MDNNGSKVEYRSSDIKKASNDDVITNVQEKKSIKKDLKKAFKGKKKQPWIIGGISALVVIALAIIIPIVIIMNRPPEEPPISAEDQWLIDLSEIRDRTNALLRTGSGSDFFEAIGILDEAITTQDAAGYPNRVLDLMFVKAGAYTRVENFDEALTVLLPMLDSVTKEGDRTSVLAQLITIYRRKDNPVLEKQYLEQYLTIMASKDIEDENLIMINQVFINRYVELGGEEGRF